MTNNLIFIFLITGEFNTFHRKSLIINFSKYVSNATILVINRPIDLIVSPLKKRFKFKYPILHKYEDTNILILSPVMLIYDQLVINSFEFIKHINYLFFKKQINAILKNYDSNSFKRVVWVMHPDLIDYLDYFSKDFVIYDCYDEFIVKKAVKKIAFREESLAKISNIIITSSNYLKYKKEIRYNHKNVIYSPTAIDPEIFRKRSEKMPEDIKNIRYPIIGFAGSFRDDIDIDIIQYIATKRKNWNIIFVGTVFSQRKKLILEKYSNIYFLGHKPLEEFPIYLSFFDIAICPHILNDFIISSSPYKIYQYLALDLDVVTTAFPEALNISRKVFAVNSKEDFLEKIEHLLIHPQPDLTDKEKKELTWENRLKDILSNIYINTLDT